MFSHILTTLAVIVLVAIIHYYVFRGEVQKHESTRTMYHRGEHVYLTAKTPELRRKLACIVSLSRRQKTGLRPVRVQVIMHFLSQTVIVTLAGRRIEVPADCLSEIRSK